MGLCLRAEMNCPVTLSHLTGPRARKIVYGAILGSGGDDCHETGGIPVGPLCPTLPLAVVEECSARAVEPEYVHFPTTLPSLSLPIVPLDSCKLLRSV